MSSEWWKEFSQTLFQEYKTYRTHSHFGFCTPAVSNAPKHFHLPEERLQRSISLTSYSNSNMSSCSHSISGIVPTVNVSDVGPMAAIKCSLCSTSRMTERKHSAYSIQSAGNADNQYQVDDDYNDEEEDTLVQTFNSHSAAISPISMENTTIALSETNCEQRLKRVIVRVHTTTQKSQAVLSQSIKL